MFRLMCKSRTRKIRRMLFSAMTAFAILVQALSISFESDAKTLSLSGSATAQNSNMIIITSRTVTPIYSTGNGAQFTNLYTTSGYAIFSLSNSVMDFRGTGYSGLSFSFTKSTYNMGLPVDSRVNGSPFFAVGPFNGFSSISDFTPLIFDLCVVIPIENPPPIYSLFFVIPFYYWSTTDNLPVFSLSYDYSCTVTDVSRPNSSVTAQDINDQTSSINNQIAQETQEQTDTLTDGYDNSQITNDNQQLADAMQDYDNSQSVAVGDSTGYIDDVSFYNPSSSAQVMSGITLTGSFLQSLFVNMGQWSAVVLVSLSLTFGLMLVGWFKFRK